MSAVTKTPFDAVFGQPRVREYLSRAVASHSVSHALLFLGAPGSGKTDAAYALAQAVLCEKGDGCGACDSCVRVMRRVHPDVHYLAPEGARGYVIAQVRSLMHDCSLAPIRAAHKVYIIDRVDLLYGAAANALLKTLEEPPDDCVFILLGRTRESVLPTILSRCQVVPFRRLPASEQVGVLVQDTGCDAHSASVALAACGGSVMRARGFLKSSGRMAVRSEVLSVLDRIPASDDLDILEAAKSLLAAVKAPLSELAEAQERELADGADYLARGVLKQLEQRQKRELTQTERAGMTELFAITRSWLRDCLSYRDGADDLVVNDDDIASIDRIGRDVETADLLQALAAVDRAQARLGSNVSAQLVIETMLFDIRKAIRCHQ